MAYGHALTLTTPRCSRPTCDAAAVIVDDTTGTLRCAPHGNTSRCDRCGSKCLNADDCDLLLVDRLLDHRD